MMLDVGRAPGIEKAPVVPLPPALDAIIHPRPWLASRPRLYQAIRRANQSVPPRPQAGESVRLRGLGLVTRGDGYGAAELFTGSAVEPDHTGQVLMEGGWATVLELEQAAAELPVFEQAAVIRLPNGNYTTSQPAAGCPDPATSPYVPTGSVITTVGCLAKRGYRVGDTVGNAGAVNPSPGPTNTAYTADTGGTGTDTTEDGVDSGGGGGLSSLLTGRNLLIAGALVAALFVMGGKK